MVKFKAGDKVRQIISKPIEGVVGRFSLDEASGDIHYRVDWVDPDDLEKHQHSRFFTENQIELVVDPEAKDADKAKGG